MSASAPLLLAVNVGSTSLKFKLLEFDAADLRAPRASLASGRLEGVGRPVSRFRIDAGGRVEEGETSLPGYDAALRMSLDALERAGTARPDAICFKPVHARDVPLEAVEMDEDVLGRMEEYAAVAPAHNPPVVAAVRAFRSMLPGVPLIGLFEPAFHRTIAPEVFTQSVPLAWIEEFGIRKYGFHGASHWYIAERTPAFLGVPAEGLRVVSCHLGGSSSLCAILGGRSVDTTMSFSPQSGLPQGARCGDIDPFSILHLMKDRGWSADRVADALMKDSGLKGLSGVSAEFREIQDAADAGDARAALAIRIFERQVQCEIARMSVATGGIDAIVFTGGIGERGARVRARVCEGIAHLGVRLDPEANARAIGVEAAIQAPESAVRVLVLPTDEEAIVARESAKVLLRRGVGG